MAEMASDVASIITVVQLTGNVVSLAYEYLWGVNEAPDDLQKLVHELQLLGRALAGLRNYAQTSEKIHSLVFQEISRSNGPLQGCAAELKWIQTKLKSGDGLRDNTKKLKWPLEEKETLLYISRIGKHKSVFALAMQLMADRENLSKAMESYVQDTDDIAPNPETESVARNLQMRVVDLAEKRKINLNWLYREDFESRHLEICRQRQSNIGGWVLQSPTFRKWVSGKLGFLLWGRGIPGAGKTFISSMIIDHFRLQARMSNYGVGYIYFDYMERDQQKLRLVLASLVKQLACQASSFSTERYNLDPGMEEYDPGPTSERLYTALLGISESFNRIFLIFDGLDECDQKDQLNELLPLFHRLAKDNISVFVSSRLHPGEIQRSLYNAAKIDLSISSDDLKTYIQQKIDENLRAKSLIGQTGCRDNVVNQLATCANGMFLLVNLHIKTICQQPTVTHILKKLETLKVPPRARGESLLDLAYGTAISNIRKQDEVCVDMALRILSWLSNARRNLTVGELQEAVSIKAGRRQLEEWDLPDRATLLDVCAGLVTIDENCSTVRLCHSTVREYLVKNSILPADVEFQIATACITYLSFNAFSKSTPETKDSLEDRFRVHQFLRYAAKHLPDHIKACDLALTKSDFLRFARDSGCVSSYMQAINGHYYRREEKSPLHLAAAMGHVPAVRQLLEGGMDPSSQDSRGRTALFEAVRGNQSEVAKLLLENAPDIFHVDEDGKTLLHWAARMGFKDIVQLLLELEDGDSISDSGGGGQTALHEATRGGHEEVVELLLENGIEIGYSDEGGYTALHEAASEGHTQIVQLLLKNGASVSAKSLDRETALHNAARGSHEEIIQLLLEKGADVSMRDRNGETALTLAARGGNKKIIQLLLEMGADISVQTYSKTTALHRAAYQGNKAIVELLLENGADVSIQGEYSETALLIAGSQGNKEVVQLLLDNGADILAQNQQGRTILHQAASEGCEEVVQLLLENGIDILIQDRMRQTALFLAAENGHTNVVQLLLENGADASIQDYHSETALHKAAYNGHTEIVQLLLDSGADVLAREEKGQAALHKAAHGTRLIIKDHDGYTSSQWSCLGHEETVELLLENGADISARDESGQTALHLAARGGRKEVLQLLLSRGADISAHDQLLQTGLSISASQGHKEAVQLFLVHGANISEKNKDGQTAFFLAAQRGHKEVVQLLLKSGSDPSERNKDGQTAFLLAVNNGHKEVIQLLLRNGADTSERDENGRTLFFLAVLKGYTEIVQLLLENGADISEKCDDGQTALFLAVGEGHEMVAQLLLKNGADISEKDKNGQTTLFLAARRGHEEVVQVLLENGADISEKNKAGQTALFLAAAGAHRKVFQLLLEKGLDGSIRDQNGRMAFLDDEGYEEEYNDDHLYPWQVSAHGW